MKIRALSLAKVLFLCAVLGTLFLSILIKPYLILILYISNSLLTRGLGYAIEEASLASQGQGLFFLYLYKGKTWSIEAVLLSLNLVPFCALVLAAENIPWPIKTKRLLVGLGALILYQVGCLLLLFSLAVGGVSAGETIASLCAILGLALPFLLWFLLLAIPLEGKRVSPTPS